MKLFNRLKFAALIATSFFSVSHSVRADALNYWGTATTGNTNTLAAVSYANGKFIAVGNKGTILTSADGITWATQTTGVTNDLKGLTAAAGKIVVVGAGDVVLVSTNATNWFTTTTGGGIDVNSVCYGQGKFVALASTGLGINKIFDSLDGTNWTQVYSAVGQDLHNYTVLTGIVYGNGKFVAMGNGESFETTTVFSTATLWSSPDSTNWTGYDQTFSSFATGLTFAQGQFVAACQIGSGFVLKTSADGVTWNFVGSYASLPSRALCGGFDPRTNDIVLVMDSFGGTLDTIRNLGTGSQSVLHHTGTDLNATSVVYGLNPAGPGEFVAVGGGSNVEYCIVYPGPYYWTNGVSGNWSAATNWSPNQPPDIYDDVIINAPGNYTVTLDTTIAANINTLTIGATNGSSGGSETLFVSGFTLNPASVTLTNGGGLYLTNFANLNSGVSVQNGGVLSVVRNARPTAPIAVQNGGAMYTDAATMPSSVTIANGGQLTANGSYSYVENTGSLIVNAGGVINMNSYLYLYGPITNYGTIIEQGNNLFYVYNDGTPGSQGAIVNQPGGLINQVGPGGGINGWSGQERFINRGTFYKSSGDNTSITIPIFDNTSGLITNAAGYLTLSTFQNFLTGSFGSASNSVIQFIGGSATNPVVAGSPFNLGGPGGFSFVGGALLLPTDIVSNLYLQSGLLELGPSFQGGAITNLTINGMYMTNTLPVTGKLNMGYRTAIYGSLVVTNGGVVMSDGVDLHGTVRVKNGGVLYTTNSNTTVDNDGSLTVEAGGQLTLDAYMYLYGPMTNAGSITMHGNDWFYIYNDGGNNLGFLINLPGGVFDQQGGGTIYGGFGNARFVNQGLYHKSFSGNSTFDINIFDNSAGVVSNSAGTLVLGTLTNQLTGSYGSAAGAAIQYYGGTLANPLTPGASLTFSGAGDNAFVGGVLLLPTNTVPGLTLRYGTLLLGPAFQGGAITNLNIQFMTLTNTLPVTGNVSMLNNSVLTGSTVVQNGGVITMNGAYVHGGLTIGNGGHLIETGSPLTFNPDSWLTINSGGVADIGYYMQMSGPVTNAGTFNFNDYNPIFFYNDGVNSFGGVVNQAGGVINFLNNGTFYGPNANQYLVNYGTINKLASLNNTLDMAHSTNFGVITSAHGSFQLNYMSLQSGGSLISQANSPSDYGTFIVPGAATFAGGYALNLVSGYIPTNLTTFNVVGYGSHLNIFDSIGLPPAVTWLAPNYGTTGLSLTVRLQQFAMTRSGKTNLVFNVQGTPGNQGVILTSTNVALSLTNWTPLVTNTFDGNGGFSYTNLISTTNAARFFILKY